jgi:hypothetical protein
VDEAKKESNLGALGEGSREKVIKRDAGNVRRKEKLHTSQFCQKLVSGHQPLYLMPRKASSNCVG